MEKVIDFLKSIKIRYYIAVLVVIIAVVGVIIFKPSYSVDQSLLANKTLDGLTIKDISLVDDGNGVTTYQATVEATTNKTVNYIEIVLTQGDSSVTLIGYVGKTLAAGETSVIKASTDADIINATSIDYILR